MSWIFSHYKNIFFYFLNFTVENFSFYASFLPDLILWIWYFLKLYPIHTSKNSIFTLFIPFLVNLVNPISCLIIPKAPSTWMLLCFFISVPSGVARFSFTFSWNSFNITFSHRSCIFLLYIPLCADILHSDLFLYRSV